MDAWCYLVSLVVNYAALWVKVVNKKATLAYLYNGTSIEACWNRHFAPDLHLQD